MHTTPHNGLDWLDEVKFNQDGLIPAIAQDYQSGRILMVAWMNREALQLTQHTRRGVYFSRSRNRLWHKGEQSGHYQQVHEIRLDCDNDVIVLQITQQGGIACHTGRESCFYRVLQGDQWQTVDAIKKQPHAIYGHALPATPTEMPSHAVKPVDVLGYLSETMQARKQASSEASYVAHLYQKGLNKILEKLGEESIETLLAAKDLQHHPDNAQNRDALIYETADLWFHSIVMLGYFDLAPQQVLDELARRMGLSGLDEKAART